jgi:Flp pilus assembly protein TadD
LVRTDPQDVQARVQLADALYRAGDYKTAKYHYNQALLQDPKNPAALNGMGLAHFRATEFNLAAASFKAAIASDATFVPAYNNLALVYEKMNKRGEAIRVLTKAHGIDANDPEVNRNLSRLKAAQ